MSNTTKEIAELQAQYDALEAQGATQFSPKARQQLEKQLREEMKKRLDAVGGDIDAFKKKKGDVARALRAAKDKRRSEIEAGVAAGQIPADQGRDEIVALGWEPAVATAAIATALKQTSNAVETLAAPAPEPEPHEEIMDPAGAAEPVTRDVVYAEPGRDPEAKPKGRKGK